MAFSDSLIKRSGIYKALAQRHDDLLQRIIAQESHIHDLHQQIEDKSQELARLEKHNTLLAKTIKRLEKDTRTSPR